MGQDRSFVLPSSFLSKRGIPVITVITVVIITTAAILSSVAAARTQASESLRTARWTHGTPATKAALLSACAATFELQTTPFSRLQSPPIQIIISDKGSLSVASPSVPLEAKAA